MKTKLTLVLVGLLLVISTSNAQRISPTKQSVKVDRGETVELTLNIKGREFSGLNKYKILPVDVTRNRIGVLTFGSEIPIEGQKTARAEYLETYSGIQFLNLKTQEISIEDTQKEVINFEAEIPYDTEPGEYYAVIIVLPHRASIVKNPNKDVFLHVKISTVSLVTIEVLGRMYELEGKADSLSVTQKGDIINIYSSFQSLTNKHLDVLGKVRILDTEGTVYTERTLFPVRSQKEEALVFPLNIRDFHLSIDKALPSGNYIAEVSYDYGGPAETSIEKEFTIKRDTPVDETKSRYLKIETPNIEVSVVQDDIIMEYIEVSNIDYRPISASFELPAGVTVDQASVEIAPGESETVMIEIPVGKIDGTQKEFEIKVVSSRGQSEKVKVTAILED